MRTKDEVLVRVININPDVNSRNKTAVKKHNDKVLSGEYLCHWGKGEKKDI